MTNRHTPPPPTCRGRIQIIPIQERPAWFVWGRGLTEPDGPYPVVAMTIAMIEFTWDGEWQSHEMVDVEGRPANPAQVPYDPVSWDTMCASLALSAGWSVHGFLVLWPTPKTERQAGNSRIVDSPWVEREFVYFTEEAARKAIHEMNAELRQELDTVN